MENIGFWIFMAASIIATMSFIAVVVWSENRRKERGDFYRFEFRKRLVDAGKMDEAAFTSLVRYEHELRMRQSREKLLTAGFIILGVGVGMCIGLQFIGASVWTLGFIPASIGAFMLLYGFLFAAKPDPGPAPPGWSADTETD